MMRFLWVLLLFASPAVACEASFRAGSVAYALADRGLTDTERALYGDLGWVTRARVVRRLEERSAMTSAVQEITRIHNDLRAIEGHLTRAETQFRLATALCWGQNRSRAEGNLLRITEARGDLSALAQFLVSLLSVAGD